MELFAQFGDEIEKAWRRTNYNEDSLPDIAADALRRADLPTKVTADEILEWTLRQVELPPQKDPGARFGDPPITLYVGPRFHVDVYFWFSGTTAIHQHSFCGAFQVLAGSSIHSWYDFRPSEAVNVFVEIGEMELKVCELLNVGDVQAIWAGRRYIHSLFHLDHPSATIVVRTDRSPLFLPQFAYHKPHLAVDSFFNHETTTKKMQALGAMLRIGKDGCDDEIVRLLGECDFHTTFILLDNLHRSLGHSRVDQMFNLKPNRERFARFVGAAEDRHPNAKGIFSAVFDHRDSSSDLVQRRGFVTDPEHRFFLALLMNVDGRDRNFELIRKRFPGAEPLEKILDWSYDLSNVRVMGSAAQNALGFDSFDDVDLYILEHLLNGRNDEEIEASVGAEYPPGRSAGLLAELKGRIERIRRSSTFKPLMS